MTALTGDLKRLTETAEKLADRKDLFRQKIHLMPPVGWLNDPNGLCQFQGVYHAFFQYSPFNPEGGVKMWGHYTSRNMIDWEYQGVPLYPDQPFDCSGVYSGAAFIEDGEMFLYYTGNVKLEDGDYDYINTGRQANTVLVSSKDGIHFGRKMKLMDNGDYPSDLTLHVRDPKVWKKKENYYMLLGARTKSDEGQALLYQSRDRIHWVLANRVKTEESFGYMWECPDYFEIGDRKILSASVQGLTGGQWEERNVYQSGYFLVEGEITGNCHLGEYRLWDYGFDYYAPQSFQAEDGRIIQIGWMGMPDCQEYTNRTIENGWQHCFTFPREIYVKDGIPCQGPVRELEEKCRLLRKDQGHMGIEGYPVYQAEISGICNNRFQAVLGEELVLEYRDGQFEMWFKKQEKTGVSAGRGRRWVDMERLENVKILADISSAEVFLNDGEYVFSTRYYPEKAVIHIKAPGAEIVFKEIAAKK